MTGQSRKHRGYRTQKVVADWFRDSGLVHDLGPTTINRLVARLEVAASGCWEWQGAKTNGYGVIFAGVKAEGTGRTVRTHRLAWELTHGPIEDDRLLVCHRCDNRSCCNPSHLFLGTHAENTADMDDKGRRVNSPHPGEENGRALLTEAEVRAIRASGERGVDLARQYGVHKSAIYSIRKRKTWRHVA